MTRSSSSSSSPPESDKGFDQRWRRHPEPQPTTAKQFMEKTGWRLEDLAGKVVLDAGCGIGRYCRFITDHGGKAIGVDVSPDGLAAARENAPQAELIQADLTIPGFLPDASVDMAMSIGVLHHTADPAQSFANVARTVKPGGQMAIWVYTRPTADPKHQILVDFMHEVTRAVPPEVLYGICREYAVQIRDLCHPAWGPLEEVLRPSYNPNDEQCISDFFDWLTPRYRFWHTVEEVTGWFTASGFVATWVGGFPVSVSGFKRG